ncbi:glycosyltransferase family 2 [Indivirus ILV1]|uniref:Glycosyltransferase family 2 n=1 Tax=Indivirus ILV1 TaxID=1977633 RepID=A0A1V0SEC5_9VIRU|nr:glycosyltransferase family 2 [Indivirus ILV1]
MSQKPKICLSMIVKNESHVIKQTLENISKYIDYYVINDTGSTDNTKEIIKEYFDSVNIPGEIIDHEFRSCNCHMGNKWKKYSFFHFGWNRSYALKQCEGKSDYIFVFDADDLIIGDMNLNNLNADCYNLRFGKGFTYVRPLIFKNDASFNWHYKDPLHEYATCDKQNYKKDTLLGNYYIESRRLGARNQDKNKYLRDAQIFEELLKENPNDERYTFYCAQSYYDHGDFENAIKFYKKRISLGNWYEEVFYSYFRIGQALEALKRPWGEVKKAYFDAYNYCKDRAEPLYGIAKYYRNVSNFKQGYKYAKIASQIPYPSKCTLFVYKDVYDYRILEELSFCAFNLEKYHEAYAISKKMLNSHKLSERDIEKFESIMKNSKYKIDHVNKNSCLIYTGNLTINRNSLIFNLIKIITKTHKTILVGNKIDIYSYKNTYITSAKTFKECLKEKSIDVDYLILYDSVDYYYENFNVIHKTTILLQQDHIIKNIFENGLIVGIKNSEYLNKIFEKLHISQIICRSQEIKEKIIETYTLDTNTIKNINFDEETEYHALFNNENNKYIFKLDIDNDTNGLVYLEPECLKYIKENKQGYHFNNQLIISYYTEIQKKQPFVLEHIGKLALLYNELGDNHQALISLDTAINLIKENKFYQPYKTILQLIKSKILYDIEKYQESYDLCNLTLKNDIIPNKIRVFYENLRNLIASEHIYDKYLGYSSDIVKTIQNNNNKNILFVTCNGDYFEKTINSFINCCIDINKIDHWLCIDESKNKINKKYPFFNCVIKKNCTLLNFIRDKALSEKFKYMLYVPPNWQFIQKRDYITECIEILESNEKNCIVSFNKKDLITQFSLSFIKLSALDETGIFCNTENPEKDYITELKLRNYNLTSLDTISAIDLLFLQSSKNIHSNLSIKVISDNNDIEIWKRFKESISSQVSKIEQNKKTNLSKDDKDLFVGNNFNYLRSIIDPILTHIDILKETIYEYTLVLNERVVMKKDYKDTLNAILNSKLKYDFIVLDNIKESNQLITKENIPIQLEKMNGYIISKEGRVKLLNFILNNKINTINYLENQNVIDTYILNKKIYDIPMIKKDESNKEFIELEGYKFYSLMDSYGHDSGYYENISIHQLKDICDKNGDAGFNTLGWIKHKINSEENFIILPNSSNPSDGLYVKI